MNSFILCPFFYIIHFVLFSRNNARDEDFLSSVSVLGPENIRYVGPENQRKEVEEFWQLLYDPNARIPTSKQQMQKFLPYMNELFPIAIKKLNLSPINLAEEHLQTKIRNMLNKALNNVNEKQYKTAKAERLPLLVSKMRPDGLPALTLWLQKVYSILLRVDTLKKKVRIRWIPQSQITAAPDMYKASSEIPLEFLKSWGKAHAASVWRELLNYVGTTYIQLLGSVKLSYRKAIEERGIGVGVQFRQDVVCFYVDEVTRGNGRTFKTKMIFVQLFIRAPQIQGDPQEFYVDSSPQSEYSYWSKYYNQYHTPRTRGGTKYVDFEAKPWKPLFVFDLSEKSIASKPEVKSIPAAFPCFQEDITMVLGSYKHCFMHKDVDPRGRSDLQNAHTNLLNDRDRLLTCCASMNKLGSLATFYVDTQIHKKYLKVAVCTENGWNDTSTEYLDMPYSEKLKMRRTCEAIRKEADWGHVPQGFKKDNVVTFL